MDRPEALGEFSRIVVDRREALGDSAESVWIVEKPWGNQQNCCPEALGEFSRVVVDRRGASGDSAELLWIVEKPWGPHGWASGEAIP